MCSKPREGYFFKRLKPTCCGQACLQMVANLFGRLFHKQGIEKYCDMAQLGTSVQDILKRAKLMGFAATAAKLTIEQLAEIPLPCILSCQQQKFIVLYKIKKKKKKAAYYYLSNADNKQIQLEVGMVVHLWTGDNGKGVAIVLQRHEENAMQASALRRPLPRNGILGSYSSNL